MCINNNRYNQTNHTLQTNHLFNDLPFMVMKIAHWLICNTYEYEAWKVIVIKLIKFTVNIRLTILKKYTTTGNYGKGTYNSFYVS